MPNARTPPAIALTLLAACAAPAADPASRDGTRVAADERRAPPDVELGRRLSARDGRDGSDVALDELFDRLAGADVVFLGETHLDETTHRFELATYEALLARRGGRVVLALEMFERDVQPAIDAYLAGAIDEATFLARSRPWGNYATAYRPLVERAKAAGAPVVASNFPAPLRARIAREGLDALAKLAPEERRTAPAEILPHTAAYWRRVDNAIRGHAGMMPAPTADELRLTDTQTLWDNSMGEACALALDAHPGWLVLHVNGGFHSEYRDGTVRQLLLREPAVAVRTVAIDPVTTPASAVSGGAPRADYVVFAEARAQDVDDGAHSVRLRRELDYRLYVPPRARRPARELARGDGPAAEGLVPLLVWLDDDGASASEGLAEWRERLGDDVAIAVLEAPYRETQEDLVEGGRWFWPDTFTEDVGALTGALEEAWGYVLRHHAVDPARVCIAGEGTGATVVAAASMLTAEIDHRAVALAPRRFAKVKDFPLPLPELRGDDPWPRKSLRLLVAQGDEAWWSGEAEAYRGIGLATELAALERDPWRQDLARENAVREALGLAPRAAPEGAPRRHVVADGPRARAWARRLALEHARESGELVAVVDALPAEGTSTELATPARAADFAAGRALPRCPGPFGGTTVVVVPAGAPEGELEAWLALEADDPLAKASRFHRLRVASEGGERDLARVLAELLEAGRRNVLVLPAEFCAGGETMRRLARAARGFEDRLTIAWRPGLGGR